MKTKKQAKLKGFKEHLPTKNCQQCGKLFQWRKKWKRDWDEVKYCSQKCKKEAQSNNKDT